MSYRVLAIGYFPEEQDSLSQKWATGNVTLDFSCSAENAQKLIDAHDYAWTIFHSRTLDCLPYIDIMRKIKSIPILILTSACTNIGQRALQNMTGTKCDIAIETVSPLHTFTYGDLYFCQEQRIVRVCDRVVDLTAKEFDLFALLISNPNRVFTYEMIMDIVWNEMYDSYSHKTITNHICNIRKKLKVSPYIPNYIKSIHSIGYKFDADIV